MGLLERHYHDLCDIEFTIEDGRLWILQTRVGKRTPEAAFRIARAMVDEGLIDADEAVRRVTGSQLAQLLFPRFDPAADRRAPDDRHRRISRGHLGPDRALVGNRRCMGSPAGTTSCSCAARPTRTTSRHGRGPRRAHRPGRQDLARGRGRTRDGPHLCLRRGELDIDVDARRGPGLGRHPRGRGRRLHRRHHRRGLPGRGPGDRLGGPAPPRRDGHGEDEATWSTPWRS